MNFRKGILALAVAGLGLTGIASAQVTCTGGLASGSVATVAAEATTAVIPTLTISSCAGTPNTSSVSIAISTSAGVSNQVLSSPPVAGATDAMATFFGGTAVNGIVSGNSIVFTAPVSGAQTGSIVITGVRVNASSQPVGSTITASAAGTGGLIFNTGSFSNVAVAYTQHALSNPVVGGFTNTAICSLGTTPVPILEAQVSNGFFGAFDATATGKVYVQVTFGNLVAGVNYYVPATITNGLGITGMNLTNSTNATAAVAGGTIGSGDSQVANVYQLQLTGTTATAIYYVTGTTALSNESFIVPLFAVATSGATVGTSSAATVTAQLLGPGNGGYDGFAAPNPAPTPVAAVNNSSLPALNVNGTSVLGGPSPTGLGELTTCSTTLLFPYILNTGGYDTGIALTNASSAPGTTVAEAGTCSMTFYGNGSPSTNPYVTSSIAAGTVNTFTVSSVASGFQGYAIAVCQFQNAHGFAFITDGYGQPGRGLSQGYLALVTSANGLSITNASF